LPHIPPVFADSLPPRNERIIFFYRLLMEAFDETCPHLVSSDITPVPDPELSEDPWNADGSQSFCDPGIFRLTPTDWFRGGFPCTVAEIGTVLLGMQN
jgi:hypothetical protein